MVARFGGAADVALAAGGELGGFVYCDSQGRLRRRLRGERPRLRGWGVALSAGGRCLWSPRPGSLVAVVAVNGIKPPSRGQAAPLPLWCCLVRLDPGWTARLAEPADSDEGSGTTPPVGRGP